MTDILETTLDGLRKAAESSPTNGHLWLQIAQLLQALGRESEAAGAARKAIEHLPDSPERSTAMAMLPRAEEAQEPSNVLRILRGGRSSDATLEPGTRESVTFADVGGLDAVKDQITMRVVLPFKRPDLYAAYGKKAGGGILLYGPPGCGKTLLARATAGEVGALFHNVTIDSILDMYFGESERKLAELFETARASAPAVLFFDELEAIGGNRQHIRNSPGKTLVNQLLAELDGAAASNSRLLILGATNAPWSVDPALRRPGRFDRVVFIPPPDEAARVEILRIHSGSRPIAKDVDFRAIAKKTAEFSGADLAALIEAAADIPLREAIRGGKQRDIARSDFDAALSQLKPTTREWFATAKNYATFANTGGLYDDLVAYLAARK